MAYPERPQKRRKTDFAAPVLSVDLAAEGEEIWPCYECSPWHVEILRDPETDEVFAREWHAADCPALEELLNNDAAE